MSSPRTRLTLAASLGPGGEPLDIHPPRTDRSHAGAGQHDTRRVICARRQDRGTWLSSGDGVATLLAQARRIPRHGTTGLDEGHSRPVCISPFGSDMTLFRPTSPCLCRAFVVLLPCSALLACPSSAVRLPLVQHLRPSEMALDGPRRLVLPRRAPFSGGTRPSQRPSDGWGMAQLSASSEYEARKKQPKIQHRRAGILPRFEVLTGALALFGTLQPHRGQPAAQSFQCHVAAFPGPRRAGWRLRIAGYEQSVKRT